MLICVNSRIWNFMWFNPLYLLSHAAPARLPSFHCCVGSNEERLAPKWYKENGNLSASSTAIIVLFSWLDLLHKKKGDAIFYIKLLSFQYLKMINIICYLLPTGWTGSPILLLGTWFFSIDMCKSGWYTIAALCQLRRKIERPFWYYCFFVCGWELIFQCCSVLI